jgi:phosphatidylserine/phosphatidylglycerophosphate/cardiolipin synthase-like enzyme
VITGSHNWTTSATTINDENTLIIHDVDIANIYRQEFEARWSEVFVSGIHGGNPDKTIFIFPNPVEDRLWIETEQNILETRIQSINGTPARSELAGKSILNLDQLTPGMYLLLLRIQDGSRVQLPFVKT